MTVRKIFNLKEESGRIVELFGNETGDPEIYIDGAWGFNFVNGICKITTFTVTPTIEPDHERREVAARILMTPPVLFALRDYLIRQCKVIEEQLLSVSAEDIQALTAKQSAPKEITKKPARRKKRKT